MERIGTVPTGAALSLRTPAPGYVPMRLFLDSNTQQALVDYSETVFEHEPCRLYGRSGADLHDVEALHGIFAVATRAHFEFVVTENSLLEAAAARDASYVRYTQEVAAHWASCIAYDPSPFDGSGVERVRPLDEGRCNYLSEADGRLVRDAVLLECDTFLTLEKRLARNADHLSRALGIEVLRPPDLWAVLRPHLVGLQASGGL